MILEPFTIRAPHDGIVDHRSPPKAKIAQMNLRASCLGGRSTRQMLVQDFRIRLMAAFVALAGPVAQSPLSELAN